MSGPLFYLIIAMHKPLSWHLGLPQDGQIILITPPSQTYEAAKAPVRPRSYLSPKARARIMADPQQRPKELIPKHRMQNIRQQSGLWAASSHKLLHSCCLQVLE